jgi:hypothetical protein
MIESDEIQKRYLVSMLYYSSVLSIFIYPIPKIKLKSRTEFLGGSYTSFGADQGMRRVYSLSRPRSNTSVCWQAKILDISFTSWVLWYASF